MIRLHFLFGDVLWYNGSSDEVEEMMNIARVHLGLEEDRYMIQLLSDESDPSVRYVLAEDRATTDKPFDVDKLPCYVTMDKPRRTIWINPPSEDMILYTEYYQFYLNDGSYYTSRYWKPFAGIDLHHATPLALARYDYLLYCKEKRTGGERTGGERTGGERTGGERTGGQTE